MNCTSVGGIVKPWLIIKPETVTLFVVGVGVGFGEEVEGVSVVTALKLITNSHSCDSYRRNYQYS
jgi:hypothetical protein